jgi:uncharacterized RDD family membrane protein YckC
MSRRVQFVTPENIEVSYELAGIGSRFMAALIDHLLQLVLIFALWFFLGLVSQTLSMARVFGGSAPLWVQAVLALASFLVLFGYFSTFEILWAGRTPGKRATGLRVVRDNGYPIDPFSSIVRNLVRIVDLMPPPYAGGLISVFVSQNYKRLGDFAAGTIVIKDKPYTPLAAPKTAQSTSLIRIFRGLIHNVEDITPDEYLLIRRFVERRKELDPAAQSHLAMRLALPLLPRLGINFAIPVQNHYPDLLEAIDSRYVEDRGTL